VGTGLLQGVFEGAEKVRIFLQIGERSTPVADTGGVQLRALSSDDADDGLNVSGTARDELVDDEVFGGAGADRKFL